MSVYVIGGGGHAKVVIATLRAAGTDVAGVLDDDAAKHGTTVLGVAVVGPVELAAAGGHPAVVAVGSNEARRRIVRTLPDVQWATVTHPTAHVEPSAAVGPGTVVFAGAVVQPDAVIGAHAIVNTAATVDHDCRLGDFVHVAPGAHLAGDVVVGEGTFVGIGSSVVPGRRVGAWSVVGAGGVVVRDLPDGVTAVGVPAKPIGARG